MGTRVFVIGLAVTGAVLSSCASTARDTLVDAINDDGTATQNVRACEIEATTLAVAAEVYVGDHGTAPASMADMVPAYLKQEPDGWVLDPSAAPAFTPAVGGPCDGVEIAQRSSASIGQKAVDVLDDASSAGCETDLRQVQVAVETHFALNGYDATTMADLVPFGVEDELDRWTLQVATDGSSSIPDVVPVVGGPCDG